MTLVPRVATKFDPDLLIPPENIFDDRLVDCWMDCYTHIHAPLRINSYNFDDPLTCHLVKILICFDTLIYAKLFPTLIQSSVSIQQHALI